MVVYNEERRIGPMLAMTLPLVDGAIIVDQSSTDTTADIARKFGCTVITDEHHGYCEPSRVIARDASKDGSWILVMDADEFLLPQFAREMRHLDPKYVGAKLKWSYWIGGEHLGDGDAHYRFARKECMELSNQIHTSPIPKCDPEQIYCPEYPAILHVKTWEEQLDGETAYRAVMKAHRFENHEHVLEASTINLRNAESRGLTGIDIDHMSISDRHKNQFGRWK